MKGRSWLCLPLALVLAACTARPASSTSSAGSSHTLTVFAAASLTQAFGELGSTFEAQNPGVKITFNFAGSQALRTQIEQGAPADVMVSADSTQMDALVSDGFIARSMAQPFVTNKLLVILPPSDPAGVRGLQDLSRPGLKLVLAAADVPVGKYARQALDQMDASFGAGFAGKVLANVVSNEDNVKQVVAKVELGEADAGIVYASDAVAAPDLKTIDIPSQLNVTALYFIAPLVHAPDAALAQALVDYVRSPAAQPVLTKWGFGVAP